MADITLQQQIVRLNIEGYKANQEARALNDEWEGKQRPADISKQIDDLMEKAIANRKEVERLQKQEELDNFYNKVDTQKLLPVVSRDELGNERTTEYMIGRDMKMYNAFRAGEITRHQWATFRDSSSDQAAAFKAALRGNHDPRVLRYLEQEKDDNKPGLQIQGNISNELKVALNEGTTTQGGYLTPDIFAQEIYMPLANLSWTRQIPRIRVINITSDNFRLPSMSYTAAAVLTTETSAYDEKEPTFAEQAFTPYKYTREVKASEEVLEDSRFDVWGELIQPDTVQAFALAENSAFAVGTGSSQPEGFTINPATVYTLATGHTTSLVGADDLWTVYFNLDFKYRPTATWVMPDGELKNVRTLKDGQNRYLLSDNINQFLGQPQMTLLGRPVVVHTGMAAPAANTIGVAFGDFYYFVIADRTGIVIIFADQLRRATGQVSWFIRKRFDSHLLNTSAITTLKHSAT